MTDAELIAGLSERDVVALTCWGESRGEDIQGRIAVANVIRNRSLAQRPSFGLTPKAVCLKPWQFSCWMPEGGAQNYALVIDVARQLSRQDGLVSAMLRECLWIASGMLLSQFGDTVRSATHYATAQLVTSAKPPSWTKGLTPVARIGAHVFYIAQ